MSKLLFAVGLGILVWFFLVLLHGGEFTISAKYLLSNLEAKSIEKPSANVVSNLAQGWVSYCQSSTTKGIIVFRVSCFRDVVNNTYYYSFSNNGDIAFRAVSDGLARLTGYAGMVLAPGETRYFLLRNNKFPIWATYEVRLSAPSAWLGFAGNQFCLQLPEGKLDPM